MFAVLGICLLFGSVPDDSKAYFTQLRRPAIQRVEVDRAGGPVILIIVDALRPDRLTPYGFQRNTTPNLKRLADEGMLFTNYFVNGNWTRPSTASLLTGLPPAAHNVESERSRLKEQFVTLAQVLGNVGIPTGAVVGNGNAGSAFGLGRGFDFFADTVQHWKGLPSAEQVTELAVPFVRAHKEKPFFLMLFFVDPHDPYHAPGEFENMFVTDTKTRLVRSPHWELGRYTPAEIERMKATYDGAVRYTDTALGKFFDTLKELGVYDKATIMVTSDHGEAFGEHGVFLHSHHFFEEIVRVPMIVRAPKMSVRGGYNHYLFQTIDLMPTIAAYYGAPYYDQLPGLEIFNVLRDPRKSPTDRVVISEFNNFGIRRWMIRSYREKIVYQIPADEKEFLATVGKRSLLPSVSFDGIRVNMFDLGKDPFERKDLYSPKRLQQAPWKGLLARLKEHLRQHPSLPKPSLVENLDAETYSDLKALGYIQ